MAAVVNWNPADTSASITLTVESLDARVNTLAVGTHGTRANISKTAGKWYWEATPEFIVGATVQAVGLANASWSLTSALGVDTNSLGYQPSGVVISNGLTITTIQTYVADDVLSIAFDMDNAKVWFRKNNGNWNNDVIGNQNPATNTGGISLAGISGALLPAWSGTAINEVLADFGAAVAFPIPSGFSAIGVGEPVTRLSVDGYGAKRAGSFVGKIASAPNTAVIPWPLFQKRAA